MVYDRESTAPGKSTLRELGFEEWQISLIERLSPLAQWEVHDEFIRRLMSNNDADAYDW